MFGMEKKPKDKKPKVIEVDFDLETELKNPQAKRNRLEHIESRIQRLKALLRHGEDKKAFEAAQTLMQAYLAAQKVINRINRKFS